MENINFKTNLFKEQLIKIIGEFNLPIILVYYVLKDVLFVIEKVLQSDIENNIKELSETKEVEEDSEE